MNHESGERSRVNGERETSKSQESEGPSLKPVVVWGK
jgi:hypothetical protein